MKERTDDIMLQKMGGSEIRSASAEVRRPSLQTIPSSEIIKEREKGEEEVEVLLGVQERDERMSFQCHGVTKVAVGQHSRQASNASNKPLPKLPVEL